MGWGHLQMWRGVDIVLFTSVVQQSLEMLRVTFTTSQCSLAYEFTQVDQNNGITLSSASGAWTTDVKSTIPCQNPDIITKC
jgi:uncharacterized membrane-anchored protein YitT (DUF2179 family)